MFLTAADTAVIITSPATIYSWYFGGHAVRRLRHDRHFMFVGNSFVIVEVTLNLRLHVAQLQLALNVCQQ